MLRLIPPVAVPLRPREVAAHLLGPRVGGATPFVERLERSVGRRPATLYGSGRAALAAWLAAVARDGRDEVVVPAYTCWSVPAAVVRAGLVVRAVDLDPRTCGPEPAAVAGAVGPATAAVVVPHLFAPSAAVEAVTAAVRAVDPSVPVLEDAAQAWPAAAPSPADALLLSFGRGKPLPLGGGGAVVGVAARLAPPRVREGGWLDALALAATAWSTRPAWYRIPESLPFLEVGCTRYRPGFALGAPFRGWQARLGAEMIERLPQLVATRTRNAQRLAAALEAIPGLELPAPARAPGPIRFPLLAPSRGTRDALLPELRRRGVAASAMYPGTLAEIAPLRPYLRGADTPGARELADRLLTVPVYPGLDDGELERIGAAVARALERVRS